MGISLDAYSYKHRTIFTGLRLLLLQEANTRRNNEWGEGETESAKLRIAVHKQTIMTTTRRWVSCLVVLRDLFVTMESPHESDQRADQHNKKRDE